MHVMARTSRHLVVDGSNIATEGRTVPSLQQLDEAVRAVQAEDPGRSITVIVDATFAHRIDSSERATFEEASDNGEILMPPAGAVGRGDAFILQVADKANAAVLSNDSFQEFHGTHPWLFDEDRLIGGKPVEGIGWIFVSRVPVRGPASRRATRSTKKSTTKRAAPTKKRTGRAASKTKAKPTGPPPVPTAKNPPPAKRAAKAQAKKAKPAKAPKTKATGSRGSKSADGATSRKPEPLNSTEDFLRFVTRHSIGDEVEAVVERFSSHGCYLRSAGAQCYLPSAAMGNPPPNRARDVVSVGQTTIVRVESLDSDRRGINVELVRVDNSSANQGRNRKNPTGARNRRREKDKTSHQTASVADETAGEDNPTRSDTTVATKKSAVKARKKASGKKVTKKSPAKATASARATKATARKAKKATKKAAPKAKKAAPKKAKKVTAKKAAPKKAKKAAKRTTKKAAPKKAKKVTAKRATKKATKKAAPKKAKKVTAKRATKKATKKAAPKKAKKAAKRTTKKAARR